MIHSIYRLAKLDCPCEEQLIRLKLQDLDIRSLHSDFPSRRVDIDAVALEDLHSSRKVFIFAVKMGD